MCSAATTLSDTGCSSVDTRMTMPFQKPKATYFQLAPCQMPMMRNVISEGHGRRQDLADVAAEVLLGVAAPVEKRL